MDWFAARPRFAALLGAICISFSGIFYLNAAVSPVDRDRVPRAVRAAAAGPRRAGGAPTLRPVARPDGPAGGHRRHLLHRRPDDVAPRDRRGRGGTRDRARQPAGHHRRVLRLDRPRRAAVARDPDRAPDRARRRRLHLRASSGRARMARTRPSGSPSGSAPRSATPGTCSRSGWAGATSAAWPGRWRRRRS